MEDLKAIRDVIDPVEGVAGLTNMTVKSMLDCHAWNLREVSESVLRE